MSLTAAASGFVVFLLSVSVVQGQDDWGVTYNSTEICAFNGSTVDINCTFTYPSTVNYLDTKVVETFWFKGAEVVDLKSDPEYSGRVQFICGNNDCTLRITDLRESDSAEYKFRFITNQPGGRYTGSPGVTLSVTDLQVQVSRLQVYKYQSRIWAELKCNSSCRLPGHPNYIWYENGCNITGQTSDSYSRFFYSGDSYSCAVEGHEDFLSPAVLVHEQRGYGVTYSSTEICALKGSTVDISCTFRYPSSVNDQDTKVVETFWFKGDEVVDLRSDPEYSDRVQFICGNNDCTLRITDLRESDSAEYKFRFTTNQKDGTIFGPTGVTLSVTDLQVQVSRSELKCHSSCRLPGHPNYVWYKNGQKIGGQTSNSYSDSIDPAYRYSCAVNGYEKFLSPPVYAPRVFSVSASPSSKIEEGSSVTLTCSSDANPAANYTWYKENGNPNLHPLSKEPQLFFSSIQSSESGEYHCEAENDLGKSTSEEITIDVRYAPKLPSVSVSPSAEIVEGSSVTLTCRSDANPAANYTWYKENGNTNPHPLSKGPQLFFSSIQSSESGEYHCEAENDLGKSTSEEISINKLPSVSVSPSAEIVEGSSVTLTCSSDANPAANYTWYKENEDSPKASGQNFTITNIRAEHSGNYYCEAQNTIGRQNSTLHLIVALDSCPDYENVSNCTAAQKEDRKQQEDTSDSCSDYENVSNGTAAQTEDREQEEDTSDSCSDYENVSNGTAAQTEDREQQEDTWDVGSETVVQGQNGWGVTYSSTEICAFKGSTVDISCTFRYPSTVKTVEKKFWFTKETGGSFVDLKSDPEYSGRVQNICGNNDCTLRITDLRESDSAVYKFRFITNLEGGKYFGTPGVTLSVTDLQVQVSRSELKCHSSCRLPGHPNYIWYKNGQKIGGQTSNSYSDSIDPAYRYSCAVNGYEKFLSPPVYAPRVVYVSVSPSAEIVEGSSVNLTCSNDANPAANYTWYKRNGNPNLHPLSKGPQLNFSSIQSSESGVLL
ncbi:B-cell receptor CD22-like [Symphorus nematophorus]